MPVGGTEPLPLPEPGSFAAGVLASMLEEDADYADRLASGDGVSVSSDRIVYQELLEFDRFIYRRLAEGFRAKAAVLRGDRP